MALRMLEVMAPDDELARIPGLLEEAGGLHVWTSAGPTAGLFRILVEAEQTEALSDLIVRHLGSLPDFRLVLLPVEATLPPVEEPSKSRQAAEVEAGPGGPKRISREELYDDIAQASRLTRVYVLMVALSTVVAAVGLIRGDVAIIIGAMVIAPLLGPNIALSLAATLGDVGLARASLRAIGVGITVAGTLSLLLGAVLAVDPATTELAARTQPNMGDVALALAAGAAGSLAFTSGVPAVVVGVMVAVALLPPLVAAGLLAGSGHLRAASGALMLTVTNVTCVNLAAVAMFLAQQVRPRTWWEASRARRATRLAMLAWAVLLVILLALFLFGHVEAV